MKKAGIVGGLGPASTLDYYDGVIKGVRTVSGSNDYPEIVIDSVNMTQLLNYVAEYRYDEMAEYLLRSIGNLAKAGADFAAIASNTPHIVFNKVRERAALPLVSIVEETCKAAISQGFSRVAVLGTLFTMRSGLYTGAFGKYGITAAAPDEETQKAVHSVIFPNLEDGIVLPEEKAKLLKIAGGFIRDMKANALVLGCTELPLAIKPGDLETPLLNTTQIHIEAIVREILS